VLLLVLLISNKQLMMYQTQSPTPSTPFRVEQTKFESLKAPDVHHHLLLLLSFFLLLPSPSSPSVVDAKPRVASSVAAAHFDAT